MDSYEEIHLRCDALFPPIYPIDRIQGFVWKMSSLVLVAVESEYNGVHAPLHARGAPLRGNGAQTALRPGKDVEGGRDRRRVGRAAAGARSQGHGRHGGVPGQNGRRTARGRRQLRAPQAERPRVDRDAPRPARIVQVPRGRG